jgi:hypothetical protein
MTGAFYFLFQNLLILASTNQLFVKYLKKPYALFLFISVISLLTFFFNRNDIIRIHLNDTGYTLSDMTVLFEIGCWFALAWTVYRITDRYLYSNLLSWLHTAGTILVVIAIYIYQLFSPAAGQMIKVYETHSIRGAKEYSQYVQPYSGLLYLLLLILQALFLYNVVKGIEKRSAARQH